VISRIGPRCARRQAFGGRRGGTGARVGGGPLHFRLRRHRRVGTIRPGRGGRPRTRRPRRDTRTLVVTVGGDGTLLRGIRVAAPMDIPVLGINSGRVGFLTEVESPEIAAALEARQQPATHGLSDGLMLTMRASRAAGDPRRG